MKVVSGFRAALLLASAAAALVSQAAAQTDAPAAGAAVGGAVAKPAVQLAADGGPVAPEIATAAVETVVVTARRRAEEAQEVPVALSVINVQQIESTGTYNVGQLTQLVPSVQFFSSNPRNTAITIRGLGTSFGLTNDGLESGVGLYIDQVYMSRPAAATFDFVDIDHVEVLRGPQGTLFGKNTTAGAISVSIKQPTFEREIDAETSAGNYGFLQGKASISGPIVGDVLAARLSVTGTLRDGLIQNVTTGKEVNNQNNFGSRLQFLYRPNDKFSLRLAGDYNHQQSICCALGFVGVGTTLKSANRQFPALAAAAAYTPASLDPFDRVTDTNSPAKANQVFGGISAIADWDIGPATLTSISAWRTWNWDPASDRDFTRLSIQTISANPDNQNQYSQEFRVASNGSNTIDYVAGIYYYRQKIAGTPRAQYGADATRWLLPQDLTLPAGLLDGYRVDGQAHSDTKSYAAFAQATWNVTPALHLTPGLRYTYEEKLGSFDQTVSGGLPPANANELTRKNSIAANQSYSANFDDGSLSGQFNAAYDVTRDMLAYATYSQGHKSGGINLAGIPSDANGNPVLATAVIKPENATTYELGLKNQLFDRKVTLNLAAFLNEVRDYQVNVVDSGPGALRGYLANIKKVSSRGLEFDAAFAPTEDLSGYLSGAWSEGKYDSFSNGPCPLELIGNSTTSCDLSGRPLPGLSRWSVSAGAEYRFPLAMFDSTGYAGVDASYRSAAYSDASDSKYLQIGGYSLLNLRAGLITADNWEIFLWAKNIFDTRYFQYLQAQTGNSGAVFGLVGDPRTFGVTLRVEY
jgi:iron complex outermembrane receptor protein